MRSLRWGLIGGGEGSQIGFAHRAGAVLDRRFEFVAAAMDEDAERGRAFAVRLGLDPGRSYGDWREMLEREAAREDRLDLVTVATPNSTHFEISKAFLNAGFGVLCEKPLTIAADEARELENIAETKGAVAAVNFGYTGYPMVRQMRAMVREGVIGKVRVVHSEFAGGFLADASDEDNPRVRWRFDPEQAGVSCAVADLGSHAMYLATYVTGQRVRSVSADFAHGVPGRRLEDDALIAFRMSEGAVGRMWVSGLAVGRTHGLGVKAYGEKGGLDWVQEHPDQLRWTPLGEATRVLERGSAGLSQAASRANRIAEGHPEGMILAFANLYRDLAEVLTARRVGGRPDELSLEYPCFADGRHMVDMVHATAASAANCGEWLTLPN